jgi:YVTN family beta-propeller protein
LAIILCLVATLSCRDALDVVPPSVQILSPLDGACAVGDVVIAVKARDDNLNEVIVFLDTTLAYESMQDSFAFRYHTGDSARHTIKAKATDRRGNWGIATVTINPVAEIQVSSNPTGATIYLDGVATPESTNHLFTDIKTGLHTVGLVKAGYLGWSDTVTALYKQRRAVSASLVANVGSLQVNSSPAGALIWLDGKSTTYTTNHLFSDFPTGLHTIKLSKTDYRDWQDTDRVSLGETLTVNAALTAVPYPDSVLAVIPIGGGPQALTYNETNNRVYCAEYDSGSVAILDATTHQLLATVGTDFCPSALVWDGANDKVYCADLGADLSGPITVFDGATNAYVATISTGSSALAGPVSLACNSVNNRVYWANREYPFTEVIDGSSNQVIGTIPAPDEWGGSSMAWDRSSNRLYISYFGWSGEVYDGATSSLVGQFGGNEPYFSCMTWDSTDSRIYAAGWAGDAIYFIDCANDTVSACVSGLSSDWLAWDRLNNKVYCASQSAEGVTVVDCATNSVVKQIPTPGHKSYGLVYDPTDNVIYSSDYDNSELLVIGCDQ